MFGRVASLVALLVLVLVDSNWANQTKSTGVESRVRSLAAELAQAISDRDAAGATRHVREDEHVVYVSDGAIIRGTEYRQTLERFYSGLKQLSFKWERGEVRVVSPRAGVFTGWANINAVDATGTATETRAIFTLLYAETGAGWELVTAHKTTTR